MKYFKSLDGVRAVAALLIMFVHFFQRANVESTDIYLFLKRCCDIGLVGVDLFFVLSGFLITRIILKNKSQEGFFKSFYWRRSLRIFPLYYLYLLIAFFISPFIFNEQIPDFSNQLPLYLYLQNFYSLFDYHLSDSTNHFWSLAVEEHFYLFWPFVVYYLPHKNIKSFIFLCILSTIIVRFFMIQSDIPTYSFTFARLDGLSLGALVAVFEFEKKLDSKLNMKIILSLLFLSGLAVFMWGFFDGNLNHVVHLVKPTLLGLIFALIIALLVIREYENKKNFILDYKIMTFIGGISYGLYVYHPLCFKFVNNVLGIRELFSNFVLSFALSFLVAFLSFRYFESYFIKLKDKFTAK